MAKTNITEFSNVASNNTDINNVNIDENCPASNLNNALRELMKALKDVDTGSQALTALSVTGNVTVAGDIQKTSGDLTVDVAGDIILDADGGDVKINDGGSARMHIITSATETAFFNQAQDADIVFKGDDGGSAVTAMTIDMSEGGRVGIGNTNPSDYGTLASDLVIGTTSGEHGLTIATGTANGGRIQFADNTSSPFRGAFEYDHSTDKMIMYTAGSSRMSLLNNGNVLIGTTNELAGINNTGVGISLRGASTANSIVVSRDSGVSGYFNRNSNGDVIAFRRSGSQVGSIFVNTSSTSYNTSSDHRLKENVEDMTGAIDRVKQLSPKRFNFIADDTNTLVDGFLAHEAQSVVAEAVTGTHNEVDDDGNAVMQGIDQAKLVPLLTGALKEAITKIEALETANTALEARITALENA